MYIYIYIYIYQTDAQKYKDIDQLTYISILKPPVCAHNYLYYIFE